MDNYNDRGAARAALIAERDQLKVENGALRAKLAEALARLDFEGTPFDADAWFSEARQTWDEGGSNV